MLWRPSTVLVAQACRVLHDEEAAEAELESARETFARLGALPDVRRVEVLQHRPPVQSSTRAGETPHALTRSRARGALPGCGRGVQP